MSRIAFGFLSFFLWFGIALARAPLQNLQVTLRGKKYEISNVVTVGDLKSKMKEVSGNSKEHHVLYDGKRLSSSTNLSEAGVEDGSQLNMVPALAKKKDKKSVQADGVRTTTTTESTEATENAMKEYLKNSGVDTKKLDELMKQMGGGDGKMPDMNETLDMMSNMMSSPLFQQYMSDPEMLEQSRQMIANNPMLKSVMAAMPGMAEILDDPVAWREAMQAAASLFKNMDSDTLKSMMSGMGGMGGPPGMGGLFDGNLGGSSESSSALKDIDELDED